MPSFCRFPFQFKSALPRVLIGLRPRWLQHIGNHKVLEDDQVFLHWQERVLEAAGGGTEAQRAFYLPTASDRYVAALHRWVNTHGGEPFAGQALPARQGMESLMDRYHSHTVHCRSCSTALIWVRRLQLVLGTAMDQCCVGRFGSVGLAQLLGVGIGLVCLGHGAALEALGARSQSW